MRTPAQVPQQLQMIAALLRAQARKAKGGEAADELNEAADRIAAFTEINASLEDFRPGSISPRLLLTRLARGLQSALIGPRPIELTVACQCESKMMVDSRIGMALGLITNELVINAIKYAFPDGRPGRIEISCQHNRDMLKVSIEDNGAGTSGEFGTGLGLQLVHNLASRNGGAVERKPGKGVRWEIHLPLVQLERAECGKLIAGSTCIQTAKVRVWPGASFRKIGRA
jgi:two-component system, sensor histidine kinase PdtaS